jgi:hypothetical protein
MSLAQFSIDDGPHNMDGLRLFAQDRAERIEAFVSRKVMSGPILSNTMEDGRVCFAINTMRLAS